MRSSTVTRRRFRSVAALTVAVLGLSAVVGLATTPAASAAAPAVPQGFSVGSWNVDLRPWLTTQQSVIDTIAAEEFDVLGLQGVWSDAAKDAILGDPRIAAKYPYSYHPAAGQESASCQQSVPVPFITDFINAMIADGIDTRTIAEPTTPITPQVENAAQNLVLVSQPCFEAVVSTLQTLGDGAAAYEVVDRVYAGAAVRYLHGGSPGRLILSNRPLLDPSAEYVRPFLVNTADVHVTVDGLRINFADWPRNYLQDLNPILELFQTGLLQRDFALLAVIEPADLVVGTLNSAPGYQPDGAAFLRLNGYVPLFDQPTFCPAATHAALPLCQNPGDGSLAFPPASTALDNILFRYPARCHTPTTFATTPTTYHIGLAAVCAKNTAPTVQDDTYTVDRDATLTVAAPGVLANDSDAQGDPLTVTPGTGPAHASSFSLATDGSFTYVPTAGYTGTDTFTYTVGDGDLTSTVATATITVRPLFPRTGVLDTFDRAAGPVGANWSGTTGNAFYRVAANALDVQAGGPLVWRPTGFGTAQEAFVTLRTIDPKGPSQGVLLKVQSAAAPDAGAITAVYDARSRVVRVSALRLGARTWTVYPTRAVTFAAGDVLGARTRPDGTVTVYRNGTPLTTITLNAADKAFFAGRSGRIGVWTLASPHAVLDDFGGGTVS